MTLSFTQPMCMGCWTDEHGERSPTQLLETEPEICAVCGAITEDGIYFRVDPSTVPFATLEKT